MYNLGENLLGVDGCTVTPRTPEIVNSLMAMTNPLDYNFNVTKMSPYDSHSSSSGSPMDSPPSVQQTCSQLIKAGLKLSLEMKRKISSSESSGPDNMKIAKLETPNTSDDEDDDDDLDSKSPRFGLTPEDEDRRRRRRERNKIAATKCRMKKRERTLNLVTESEVLETQNVDLKAQVRQLELERRKLTDMLHAHNANCLRPEGFQPPAPPTISVEKYIPDLGSDLNAFPSSSSGSTPRNSTTSITTTSNTVTAHQPIPSVNTIKYGHTAKIAKSKRHQQSQPQQQHHHQHQLQTQQQPQQQQQHQPSQTTPQMQHHQQPPLIDIGYCSSSGISSASDLLPPTYCKSSPNDYAMSPDSGFMKSPVDTSSTYSTSTSTSVSSASTPLANNILYTSLTHNNLINNQQQHQHLHNNGLLAVHIKSDDFDHIPNCSDTNGGVADHHQHQLDQLHQHLGLHVGPVPGDGSEFALKCENIDSNSPYTTVNSADRFLFDGNDSHHFDSSGGGMAGICVDPGRELRLGDMHVVPHNHLHLNNNNSLLNSNNNNSTSSNMNMNGSCGSIIEYNGQCHSVFDGMKTDYHSDFLADVAESQFTDMDSGMTTYTNMVANSSNNGCMA